MQKLLKNKRLVDSIVSDDFQCPICLDIIDYPNSVQDNHGHIFCQKCIEEWLKITTTCPLNRLVITQSTLKPLQIEFKQRLDELKIYCKNKAYGCEKVCTIETLKSHESQCTALDQYLMLNPKHLYGYLISGCMDGNIKIWNLTNFECIQTIKNRYDVSYMEVQDELFVVQIGSINIWNLETGKLEDIIETLTSSAYCFAIWEKSTVAISNNLEKVIEIYNNKASICVTRLEGHTRPIYSLAFFKNGNLVSGGFDKTLKIWDIDTSESIYSNYDESMGFISVICVIDDIYFATGTSDKRLRIWNSNTMECVKFQGHTDIVISIAVLNSRIIASGSNDRTIRIWNRDTAECINTLIGHTDDVKCLVKLNENIIASGSGDKTIKIWDTTTGECLKTIEESVKSVPCLAYVNNIEI